MVNIIETRMINCHAKLGPPAKKQTVYMHDFIAFQKFSICNAVSLQTTIAQLVLNLKSFCRKVSDPTYLAFAAFSTSVSSVFDANELLTSLNKAYTCRFCFFF